MHGVSPAVPGTSRFMDLPAHGRTRGGACGCGCGGGGCSRGRVGGHRLQHVGLGAGDRTWLRMRFGLRRAAHRLGLGGVGSGAAIGAGLGAAAGAMLPIANPVTGAAIGAVAGAGLATGAGMRRAWHRAFGPPVRHMPHHYMAHPPTVNVVIPGGPGAMHPGWGAPVGSMAGWVPGLPY